MIRFRVAIESSAQSASWCEASSGHEGKKAGRAKEHGATHALVHEEPPKPDKSVFSSRRRRKRVQRKPFAPLAAAEAVFAPAAPQRQAEVPSVGAPCRPLPGRGRHRRLSWSAQGRTGSRSHRWRRPKEVTTKTQSQALWSRPTLPMPLGNRKRKSLLPDALESESGCREKLKRPKRRPGPEKKTKPNLRTTPPDGDLRGDPITAA